MGYNKIILHLLYSSFGAEMVDTVGAMHVIRKADHQLYKELDLYFKFMIVGSHTR